MRGKRIACDICGKKVKYVKSHKTLAHGGEEMTEESLVAQAVGTQ